MSPAANDGEMLDEWFERMYSKLGNMLHSHQAIGWRRGWNEAMRDAQARIAAIARIQACQQQLRHGVTPITELFERSAEDLFRFAEQIEMTVGIGTESVR